MENEILIYRVLAKGLLDIRVASHENNSKVVFHLADFLHNVPLHMDRARQEGKDYSEILESMRERAEQKGMTKWLDNALAAARKG